MADRIIVDCTTGDERAVPLTPTEMADRKAIADQADQERQVSAMKGANESTLRQQAHDSLSTLRTSIDTLKAITAKTNANVGPADTKAVARETRRVARQVLALTRLLIGALDTVDTGTE